MTPQLKKENLLSLPAVKIARAVSARMQESAIAAYSGQTSFFIILSFFPFLIFLFAILRMTPLTEENFMFYIVGAAPSSFRDVLDSLVHSIYTTGSGQVLSLSIISAVWLSSKFFYVLICGLNAIYRRQETRSYLLLRFLSCIYSVLFAIFLVIILALLVFGKRIYSLASGHFPYLASAINGILSFRMLISAPLLFVFFLLLYYFLPNCKWKLFCHLPGAALSTAGWLIFSHLYSYYINTFSNYSAFYGTMTTIALLMVWLYACMYILFLGGFVNCCLYERFAVHDFPSEANDSSGK